MFPIGHKLNEFDKFSDSLSTIAGIFKNFPLNSLEEEIGGQQISIGTEQDLIQKGTFIQIKLIPEYYKETLVSIEKLWKEMNGDRGFKYVDMHKEFMLRNNKVIILSNPYQLLIYCIGPDLFWPVRYFMVRCTSSYP